MTEDELEAEVDVLCGRLGLLSHHCLHSRRCRGQKGFPDRAIAGPGGHFFRELKSADGETSADQDLWAWTLQAPWRAGRLPMLVPHWRLWTPADLESGLIGYELEFLR